MIDRPSIHNLEIYLVWGCSDKAGDAQDTDIVITFTFEEVA